MAERQSYLKVTLRIDNPQPITKRFRYNDLRTKSSLTTEETEHLKILTPATVLDTALALLAAGAPVTHLNVGQKRKATFRSNSESITLKTITTRFRYNELVKKSSLTDEETDHLKILTRVSKILTPPTVLDTALALLAAGAPVTHLNVGQKRRATLR
jgi:mannose/fructose/N-acetylgalactosamine-specific phosphotransferase system component IIB